MPDYLFYVFLFGFTVLILNLFRTYLYSYEIHGDVLKVKLYRVLSVATIPLRDIDEVEVSTLTELLRHPSKLLLPLYLGPAFPRVALLIRRHRGVFQWIIIAPDDPYAFAESLRRAAARAREFAASGNHSPT